MTEFVNLLIWAAVLWMGYQVLVRTIRRPQHTAHAAVQELVVDAPESTEEGQLARDIFMLSGHPVRARERFVDRYEGRWVSWRGTVRRHRRGHVDVMIAEARHPQFGRRAVQVRAKTDRVLRVGSEVVVDGVAESIDFYGMTVTLADADVREVF